MVELKYERDVSNSYIVIKIQEDQLETHALKMMRYNKLPHFLPISEKTENTEVNLYYNITGLMSVQDILKHNAIEYPLLKAIVESMLELIDTTQEYFLSEECFYLSAKTLFFSPETKQCYYLYLPYGSKPFNFTTQLKTLIYDLFPFIHKQDEKAISLIHKLRMVIDDVNFGITSFKKIMDFEEHIMVQSTAGIPERLLQDTPVRIKKTAKESINKKPINKEAKLTFLLLQILLVALVGVCLSRWIVTEDNQTKTISKIVIVIAMGGLLELVMIIKVLFGKGITKTHIKPVNSHEEIRPISKWGWDTLKVESLNTQNQIEKKRAYWVDGQGVKVPIIKSPFMIGKMKEAVDFYLSGDLISRIHCKIFQELNQYYIMDLNSKNGTILNNQKLTEEMKVILHDGDHINLAGEVYQFRLL